MVEKVNKTTRNHEKNIFQIFHWFSVFMRHYSVFHVYIIILINNNNFLMTLFRII